MDLYFAVLMKIAMMFLIFALSGMHFHGWIKSELCIEHLDAVKKDDKPFYHNLIRRFLIRNES